MAGFSVANGRFTDPNGNDFVPRGVNLSVYANYGGTTFANMMSMFPGANFFRLVTNAGGDQGPVDQFIADAAGQGVVCMIDNHDIGNTLSGQALTDECNWYAGRAARYANNPYVWFNTINEPNGDYNTIVQEQVATYNAIRGAGSNAILLMELRGGGYTDWLAGQGGNYAGMYNVGWDTHFYGYLTGDYGSFPFDSNPAAVQAALANEIGAAQAIRSADGIMPAVIGEFGPSTSGAANTTDNNGQQVLDVVLNNGVWGFVAWAHTGTGTPGGDALSDGNTSRSGYGDQVAAKIAALAGVAPSAGGTGGTGGTGAGTTPPATGGTGGGTTPPATGGTAPATGGTSGGGGGTPLPTTVTTSGGLSPLNPLAVALVSGNTIAVEAKGHNAFVVNLTGNGKLLNPTNTVSEGFYILSITQGPGGPYTLSYDSQYQFEGGKPPKLAKIAGVADVLYIVAASPPPAPAIAPPTSYFCFLKTKFSRNPGPTFALANNYAGTLAKLGLISLSHKIDVLVADGDAQAVAGNAIDIVTASVAAKAAFIAQLEGSFSTLNFLAAPPLASVSTSVTNANGSVTTTVTSPNGGVVTTTSGGSTPSTAAAPAPAPAPAGGTPAGGTTGGTPAGGTPAGGTPAGGTAGGTTPPVVAPGPNPTTTGNFYVSGGEFVSPNGTVWRGHGVNVVPYANYQPTTSANVRAVFPGINMVRLPVENIYGDLQPYYDFIADATANGVVCLVENHQVAVVLTGQALQDEINFYATMAATYRNNPYVWFASINEPDGNWNDLIAEHIATYNAIRGAGNNTIILFMPRGGSYVDFLAGNNAYLTTMTNVGWDTHFYGWATQIYGTGPYDTTPGATAQALLAQISATQAYQSADGMMPILVGEFGPSTTGSGSEDPNAQDVLNAVFATPHSFTAWAFSGTTSPGPDSLSDDGHNLTGFGQQVAARIAQG